MALDKKSIPTQTDMTDAQNPDAIKEEFDSEVDVVPSKNSTSAIKLKKEIGPLLGIAIVMGAMMGSGIFITPSFVLANAGSVGTTLVVWTVAGLISIVGSLCYVELGTMIVESGGDYAYIYAAFGPLPAFLYVWVTTMVGAPTMLAILASAFSNYALYPFYPLEEGCSPPPAALYLLSAVCLLLVTFLNAYSMKWVTHAQGVCTTMVVVALVLITGYGILELGKGNTGNFVNAFQTIDGLSANAGSVAVAFYAAWFAFGGWSILNFLIEELRNPIRNLPIILFVTLPLVTLINVFVNVAYFAVLKPKEILASKAVAFTFANKIIEDPGWQWVMPIGVAISMIGALNGGLLKGSRTCMVGARKGQFPSILGMIQVNRKTPLPALAFVASFALIFLASNDIGRLINCFSLVTWGTVLSSIVGLLYLRWKRPDLKRPFKVNLLLPIIFVVACAALLMLSIISAPFDALIGLGMTLTGFPVYFICIYQPKKPERLRKITYAVTVFLQKSLFVGSEEKSDD